jgi:hypothetical protein
VVVEKDQFPLTRAHGLVDAVAKEKAPVEDWDRSLLAGTKPATDMHTD